MEACAVSCSASTLAKPGGEAPNRLLHLARSLAGEISNSTGVREPSPVWKPSVAEPGRLVSAVMGANALSGPVLKGIGHRVLRGRLGRRRQRMTWAVRRVGSQERPVFF